MADIVTKETDEILGSVQQAVAALIQGRQLGDTRLYEAINLLNLQLEKVSRELSPLIRKSLGLGGGVSELPAPVNFDCFSTGTTLRFLWDQVSYAAQYEVRMGLVWESALFLFRTSGLQGDIDPLIYGDYNFLIKTLDSEGNYSADATPASFQVTVIAAPKISVSVIDNNVLLYWTEPESIWKIDYYLVDKFGDAQSIGRVDGTFTTLFEVVAGTYQYEVRAVDIAGNTGNPALVEASVATPPDFALQDTRVSGLNGTRVNVLKLLTRPSLLCCWRFPQTWQEHFRVFNNWMDIEDQITAGYPIYIQPTSINGSYEEIFDYGAVINNTIVSITWNTIVWTPLYAMNVVVRMATSTDGVSYSTFSDGSSQYFRQLRYLKLRLEFTAENDKTFIELYNLTVSLNVKRENDGGEALAVATDAAGTTVYFQKVFKDIESITCTTKSTTEPYVVIFDFNDIPNPTFFKVFVFDTMGARVTRTIDWKARGIV